MEAVFSQRASGLGWLSALHAHSDPLCQAFAILNRKQKKCQHVAVTNFLAPLHSRPKSRLPDRTKPQFVSSYAHSVLVTMCCDQHLRSQCPSGFHLKSEQCTDNSSALMAMLRRQVWCHCVTQAHSNKNARNASVSYKACCSWLMQLCQECCIF